MIHFIASFNTKTKKGVRQHLAELETLLSSCPDSDDVEGLFSYMAALRAQYGTLAGIIGRTEVWYSKALVTAVSEADPETFKKIKGSSTLIARYAESKANEEAFIYHQAQTMKNALRDATSQLTTQIAFMKEQMAFDRIKPKQN